MKSILKKLDPRIKGLITESIMVKQTILEDETMLQNIQRTAEVLTIALKAGNKVLFCGNGGSAADAQHLAAELSGRFYMDREPLFAEALHVNTSYLTAVANDYSYDEIFARAVKAKGRMGDVLVAISTSGNSMNILKAIDEARYRQMVVIGMTASTGGKMRQGCDYLLNAPTTDTMRAQEAHIMIGHLICELVEKAIF